MDIALLETFGTLGLGALVAGIVLTWKRADDSAYQERLSRLIERRDDTQKELLVIIQKNTEAMEGMSQAIEALSKSLALVNRLEGIESTLAALREKEK